MLFIEELEDRISPAGITVNDPVYLKMKDMPMDQIERRRDEISKRVDQIVVFPPVIGVNDPAKLVWLWNDIVTTVKLWENHDEVKELHHEIEVIRLIKEMRQ